MAGKLTHVKGRIQGGMNKQNSKFHIKLRCNQQPSKAILSVSRERQRERESACVGRGRGRI
jgi:hypothetical protein